MSFLHKQAHFLGIYMTDVFLYQGQITFSGKHKAIRPVFLGECCIRREFHIPPHKHTKVHLINCLKILCSFEYLIA